MVLNSIAAFRPGFNLFFEACAAYQNSLRGRDSSLEFSSVVVANKKGERVGVAAKEVKSIDVAEPSLPRF